MALHWKNPPLAAAKASCRAIGDNGSTREKSSASRREAVGDFRLTLSSSGIPE
jgi:hypothetical protein